MYTTVWASIKLLAPKRRLLLGSLVLLRVLVHFLDVLGLLSLGVIGVVVARGLSEPVQAGISGINFEINGRQDLVVLLCIIAGLFVIKSLISTLLLRLTTKTLASFEAAAAQEIAENIYSEGLENFYSFPRAQVNWLITTSTQVAFSGVLFSAASVVTEFALFLAIFVVFLATDFFTAFLVAGYFGAIVLAYQLVVSKRLLRLGTSMRVNSVGTTSTVLTLSDVFREATVHHAKSHLLKSLVEFRTGLAENQALQRFLFGLPRPFVEVGMILGVVSLAIFQLQANSLETGVATLAVFLTGGVRMMAAILPLQNAVNDLKVTLPQASPAQDFIRESRKKFSGRNLSNLGRPIATSDESVSSAVVVNSGTYQFADSTAPTLFNIDLEIRTGQRVAIIGKSGAGKSTLVELILGLRTATQGSIRVFGADPVQDREKLKGKVAYVPQKPGVIPNAELWQNISLLNTREKVDFDRVMWAIQAANLADYVSSLPHGIESVLADQGQGLSGGQLQRLGLARALYQSAELIVLDEATSALDAEVENGIVEMLDRLASDVTQIVIAHRLSTVQNSDVVFLMDGGQIIDRGTLGELRRRHRGIENQINLMNVGS